MGERWFRTPQEGENSMPKEGKGEKRQDRKTGPRIHRKKNPTTWRPQVVARRRLAGGRAGCAGFILGVGGCEMQKKKREKKPGEKKVSSTDQQGNVGKISLGGKEKLNRVLENRKDGTRAKGPPQACLKTLLKVNDLVELGIKTNNKKEGE